MTDGGWLWNGRKLTSFSRKMSVTFGAWLVGHRLSYRKMWLLSYSPQFAITQILAWGAKPVWSPRSGSYTSRAVAKYGIYSGALNERWDFCKISVRRSKYCLEFSIIWGRLKISIWSFHLCKIFDAYLTNSLRFSEKYFSHFTAQVRIFFLQNRKPKFSDSRMWWREESEKFSLRNTLNCI